MRNEGTGGKCFVLEHVVDHPDFAELMTALNTVNALPDHHKPKTMDYDDIPMLGIIAAAASIDLAFELFTDHDGKPGMRVVEVHTIAMPPGMEFPPFMVNMSGDDED
jgi:hypothetical protein